MASAEWSEICEPNLKPNKFHYSFSILFNLTKRRFSFEQKCGALSVVGWGTPMEDGFRSCLPEMLSSDLNSLCFNSWWKANNSQRGTNHASFYFLYLHQCVNEWLNDRTGLLKRRLEKNRRKARKQNLLHTFPESAVSLLWEPIQKRSTQLQSEMCWPRICAVLSPLRKNCALSDSDTQHSVAHDGKSTNSLLLSESIVSMLMGPGGNNISQF